MQMSQTSQPDGEDSRAKHLEFFLKHKMIVLQTCKDLKPQSLDLVHTTLPSFHPFIYGNLDLEDTLLSEISVPNKNGSHLVSDARMNTLKTETQGRKGLFTYPFRLLVTSPLLWGSQGRKAKHQMYSQKQRELNAWNLACLLSASSLLSYSVQDALCLGNGAAHNELDLPS